MAPRIERRLAAILAADVVGYSRLVGADEAGTIARLRMLRKEFIEPLIVEYRGRVVKLVGDGALVEFASAVDAVECAVAIQNGVAERESAEPQARRIQFRIGINLGDIIVEDGDILGDGVNFAARLEGFAAPGGICIARNVHNQVRGKLALGFEPMGAHRVKNIAEPVEVWRVLLDGAALRLRLDDGAVPQQASIPATTSEAGGGAEQAPLDQYRIAVLPFVNMSADPENEYFSDSVTEEMISKLSRVHDLTVIARTSIMQYKATNKGIAQIGRELRAGTILEGSVRKAGDRLRITAQLVDVASEGHLWSQDYDRTLDDVFAIQSDVAQNVAEALEVTLGAGEKESLGKEQTKNLDAYNLYVKGLYHWHKLAKENLSKARRYFEQAIELDPTYASAHAWLAYSYQIPGEFGHVPANEAYPKAKDMAEGHRDRCNGPGSLLSAGNHSRVLRLGLGGCRSCLQEGDRA